MANKLNIIFGESLLNSEPGLSLPLQAEDYRRLKVLVVIEGFLKIEGRTGFNQAVGALLNSKGLFDFQVHYAEFGSESDHPGAIRQNPNPTASEPHYTTFRYNSVINGDLVINNYDQIWCFGAVPILNNPNLDNLDNTEVTELASSCSVAEINALSDWMDNGGGILAAGDHGYIGAAMCWNTPRVGSMRAWLRTGELSTSVTDMEGINRHDTNRPTAGTNSIPKNNQGDEVPQDIRPMDFDGKPHPLLSYKTDSVVDVFPDHAHEGRVQLSVDTSQKCWHDENKDEYPKRGENWPQPEVIALGNTLGDAYHYPDKGPVVARDVVLASVYNGHPVNVGRVVVNSTWHHWMNVNVENLRPDAKEKVFAFFTNTGTWLAPQTKQKNLLMTWLVDFAFATANIEDVTIDTATADLGRGAIAEISQYINGGLVLSYIEDAMAPSYLSSTSTETRILQPFREYARQVFVGYILKELAKVRDLTLLTDGNASEQLAAVPATWLDDAMEQGTKAALQQLQTDARDSMRDIEGFLNSIGS